MAMTLFWFRRDLRLDDNAGLYHALKHNDNVQPIFIFDPSILSKLPSKEDPRVQFLHQECIRLKKELKILGADLWIYHAKPSKVFDSIIKDHNIKRVYTNRDYEPYALERDNRVEQLLSSNNIGFHTYKDQVIFESNEVLKKDGLPYTVFTPYKRKWLEKIKSREDQNQSYYFKSYPTNKYFNNLNHTSKTTAPTLEELGFIKSEIPVPSRRVEQSIIKNYSKHRDYPALNGTSRLGIHFRFGTISIREKARKASILNETYLSELIWRDFYSQILRHFPHVVDGPFRKKYDYIDWRNNEEEFDAWCQGKTGYPLVDAGMRELNYTGFMHNRVRMLVASFLTKHLLIDWRWGEKYFAEKLLDYDLASNNGGWQWAAGCGTDAAPYFRIFNPTTQFDKFDKQRVYVKKWLPEWGTEDYPEPIVDHKIARERCLGTYKEALDRSK